MLSSRGVGFIIDAAINSLSIETTIINKYKYLYNKEKHAIESSLYLIRHK